MALVMNSEGTAFSIVVAGLKKWLVRGVAGVAGVCGACASEVLSLLVLVLLVGVCAVQKCPVLRHLQSPCMQPVSHVQHGFLLVSCWFFPEMVSEHGVVDIGGIASSKCRWW